MLVEEVDPTGSALFAIREAVTGHVAWLAAADGCVCAGPGDQEVDCPRVSRFNEQSVKPALDGNGKKIKP